MIRQKGISQVIVMVVMLVLAIALPITTKLVQQSQENRSKASGTWSYLKGTTCVVADVSYGSKSECESALKACNSNTTAKEDGWACYGNNGTCYANSNCKGSCSGYPVCTTSTGLDSTTGSGKNLRTCTPITGGVSLSLTTCATDCSGSAGSASCNASGSVKYYFYNGSSCVQTGDSYASQTLCTNNVRSTCYTTQALCNSANSIGSQKYYFYNGSSCVQTGDSYASQTLCTNNVRSTCYTTQSACNSANGGTTGDCSKYPVCTTSTGLDSTTGSGTNLRTCTAITGGVSLSLITCASGCSGAAGSAKCITGTTYVNSCYYLNSTNTACEKSDAIYNPSCSSDSSGRSCAANVSTYKGLTRTCYSSQATCESKITSTKVNGACGTTNNSCTAGALSDTTDTSTLYKWNCVGTNGGTTASCSATITTTGSYFWYYATSDITLTTGAVVSKGTCQQTSNTYTSSSLCAASLNSSTNNTYGKTTGVCYTTKEICVSSNSSTAGTPTITAVTATTSGTNGLVIKAVGVSIDHASIVDSDKSTFVANMTCSGTTSCTYTISGLTAGKTYTYWVKACSVDNGDTCPSSNTAWKSVSAKVGSLTIPTIKVSAVKVTSTSYKIIAAGVNVDHAAVVQEDGSTFVGNMTNIGTGATSTWTYTLSSLTVGTTYTYGVKACSIDTNNTTYNDTCPDGAVKVGYVTFVAGAGNDSIVNIKMAFTGVKSGNGQCATNWPVTLKMVDSVGENVLDGTFTATPTQTSSVNSRGEIIYDLSVTVLGVPTEGGKNLAFFLAGPKHISLKYGKNGQTSWYSSLAGTLSITAGESNSYDFSSYPLLAGDVTGDAAGTPDGKIDARDWSYVKNKIGNRGSSGNTVDGDVDGNCLVNAIDPGIIRQEITEINGQTY